MIRDEDIDEVKLNISNIMEEAAIIYKSNYEPTLTESKEVYSIILDFIKENKRVIYGGYAQNKLIKLKNKEDYIYKETDVPDVEFYSYEPIKDTIELCNKLYAKGCKFIQGKEGIHNTTYKIFINFINYCDITYLAKNIYDRIPFIEDNNVRYAHPTFLLIDIYRVFVDPMTSYFRLDKSFNRYVKMIKYYPIRHGNNKEIKFNNLAPDDVLDKIRKKIIQNSDFIMVGSYAYNYYVKKVEFNPIKINFYEMITNNLKEDSKKIYDILNKLYPNKITTKEYYPFYEFFDSRIEFLYDDIIILRLYNNNSRCIVYNQSDKKKIKIGTVQLVSLYLLSNHIYYLINKNNLDSTNYMNMFIKLNEAKNKYLDNFKITVLNNSPFQDFQFNCIGQPVDLIRETRLSEYTKKVKKFKYEPKGKEVKIPDYKFNNSSGNQILNNKYLNLIF